MHCWEFHHADTGGGQWFWRCVDKEGHIHAESRRHFITFMSAFMDAKGHGFDDQAHEWYLATPTHQPCVKVVEGGKGKAPQRKRAA